MAQLPPSMRRKRVAITSIHDKPPTRKEKMINAGGWVMLIFACCVLLIGIYGLYSVMTSAKVASLDVVGLQAEPEINQVKQQLMPTITGNYFTADLEQIRDKALEISWVDRVVISRAWPDGIKVRVIPKHPIARWGTGRLLSDQGVVYTEAYSRNHANLPLMHGPSDQSKVMMRRYHEINQLFSPVNLRLKELYLTDRRTWFMQFDSGLRIIVDQDQTMSKLQRLSHLSQADLKVVWPRVSAIDLRYRNGLAIQWKNATPPKIINGQFVVTINDINIADSRVAKP